MASLSKSLSMISFYRSFSISWRMHLLIWTILPWKMLILKNSSAVSVRLLEPAFLRWYRSR